jgi:hypothetical protein
MNIDRLNESELKKILHIAQEGESKIKEMSDRATMMAEKWRVKTSQQPKDTSKNDILQS